MDSTRNERLEGPPYLGSAHGQAPPTAPWLTGTQEEATPGAGIPGRVAGKGC